MERLSFDSSQRYLAIEAAVHIARYSMARPVCGGKRVLDIACGEGYGSYAMAVRWGALSVSGIDLSSEAISAARQHFTASNVDFETGSAYDISKRFSENSFDLIVCLETIEHLEDPQLFLRELQRVAAPNATFIISCPNDPRHYGSRETGNPFHIRSYSAEEFFSMVEEVLGACTRKFIGTPVTGFGNFAIGHEPLQVGKSQSAMVEVHLSTTLPALLVPPDDFLELDNGSYYVGVWSGDGSYPELENAALYPCDMNSAAQACLENQVELQRTRILELENALAAQKTHSENDIKIQGLRVRAAAAVDLLAREGVANLKASSADLETNKAALHEYVATAAIRLDTLSSKNETISIQLVEAESKATALAQENAQLIEKLQHIELEQKALNSQNEQALKKLSEIPWRVVSTYHKLRPWLPLAMLKSAANFFDRQRSR